MKSALVLIVFCSVLAATHAQQTNTAAGATNEVQDLDAKCGFRDLKFGQHISHCTGMCRINHEEFSRQKFSIKDEDLKTYVRKSDELQLGDTPLQSIEYEFYKDKLMSVVMVAEGICFTSLCGTFKAALGEGRVCAYDDVVKGGPAGGSGLKLHTQTNHNNYLESWSGRLVAARISTFPKYDTVICTLESIQLTGQRNADEKAEANAMVSIRCGLFRTLSDTTHR